MWFQLVARTHSFVYYILFMHIIFYFISFEKMIQEKHKNHASDPGVEHLFQFTVSVGFLLLLVINWNILEHFKTNFSIHIFHLFNCVYVGYTCFFASVPVAQLYLSHHCVCLCFKMNEWISRGSGCYRMPYYHFMIILKFFAVYARFLFE